MPPPSWRRPLLACALGLLALATGGSGTGLPRLDSAPAFAPGGAFVLAAFIGLGTGAGLLSALIFVTPLLAALPLLGPGALLLALLRLAESWGTCLLYRRVGSLVFAVSLYWLTAGALLDFLALALGFSLPLDALALLFVHQFVGGLVNAIVAEGFLRLPALRYLLPARDELRAMNLQQYVFSRVAFVATIPALVLALFLARAAYDGALASSDGRLGSRLHDAHSALSSDLGRRAADLARLARQVEMDWNDRRATPTALLALQPAPAGFEQVSLLGAGGRVLASSPSPRSLVETRPGAEVGGRPWFQVVRDRIGPAVSPFFRGSRTLEPMVLVAEPLLRPDGSLRGALLAVLDPRSLHAGLPPSDRPRAEPVALLDSGLMVLASADARLRTGDSLRGRVPRPAAGRPAIQRFSWEYPPSRGLAEGLGLTSGRAVYATLSPWGFTILAERPAAETRRELLPVAGRILGFFALMLLLLYLVVARFARRVSGPLLALDDASGAIAQGRFPVESALVRLFESPIAEIRSVAYRFLAMRDALAYRDALTGLPNRALFLDRLVQALAQARRDRQRLAVLRLGLDRFRLVQDTLGHAAGDALLQTVAARLREPVREADTVARLAADEFGVLVRQVHEPGDAARVARKLLDAVRMPVVVGGREIVITASVGLALFPGDADHDEALLQNADAAMHRAKVAGGDTYRLYTPAMNDHALEQLALESALRRAVAQGEFEVHYQPIVDLTQARLAGVEALVRWRHPDRGLVAPSEFIALTELSGLIVPIGSFVLKAAAAQAKAWRDQGFGPIRLQVNLSARQFQHADLLNEVSDCLAETGLPPEALELEITESTAMQDVDVSVATLEALRAQGVRISLDDFGTGYSSLNYLKALPVDTVKLDQSFVRHVTTDRDDAAIATAILSLARSLDLAVIAEGVESREQLEFLQDRGCDTMQGFLFSRPLSVAEMEKHLRSGVSFAPVMA